MKNNIVARINESHLKYSFQLEENPFKYAQAVILKIDKKKYLAYINSFPSSTAPQGKDIKEASFLNYATPEDLEQEASNTVWLRSLKKEIIKLASKENPKMKVSHLRVDLDRKALFVYYTAAARVDFRSLLAELNSQFKIRTTFVQLSSRQRFDCFYHPSHIDYKAFSALGRQR